MIRKQIYQEIFSYFRKLYNRQNVKLHRFKIKYLVINITKHFYNICCHCIICKNNER